MKKKKRKNTKEKVMKDEPKRDEAAEVIGFDKAFRIFKLQSPLASLWDKESVKVFVAKRMPSLKASLEDFIEILNKY